MLMPDRAVPWNAPPVESLSIADVADLIALDPPPEFLLLGTGSTLVHPPRAFVRSLEERGIGLEAMDSRAAARAWGVLRAEERWIVAAFLPL
jgi:uncharacterized protein